MTVFTKRRDRGAEIKTTEIDVYPANDNTVRAIIGDWNKVATELIMTMREATQLVDELTFQVSRLKAVSDQKSK